MTGAMGCPKIRALLDRAEASAVARGVDEVGSLDVILAITSGGEGAAAKLLERSGASAERLLEIAENKKAGESPDAAARGSGAKNGGMAFAPPAAELARALARAPSIAARRGHAAAFEPEDLFLALLEDRGARASEVLRVHFGLSREQAEDALASTTAVVDPSPEGGPIPAHPDDDGAPAGIGAEVREIDARTAELEARVHALEGRLRVLLLVIVVILFGLAVNVLSTSPTIQALWKLR